ncbi:MAG: hypothetical protein QOI05_766 [Bradyrhizobium sp.]|jgi:biotin carboxylase|nr:hypothetical protein [Bradyrhizobium sp.]
MSSKTVLYICGRKSRIELIEYYAGARRLGIDVVLIADEIPTFVRAVVKDFAVVKTSDYPAVIAAADALSRKHTLSAVANWSEKDTIVRNMVARRLNLPGMTEEAALLCRDKVAMRRALETRPDLIPLFYPVQSAGDLQKAIEYIGFPGILKPAAGSASRGIFKINSSEDGNRALRELERIVVSTRDSVFSGFDGKFIYEEFLDGPEVSVEGYSTPGGIDVVGITDKWMSEPFSLEERFIFPSIKPQVLQDEIIRKAKDVVKALGIVNSTFHLEGRCTRRGFKLLECAARPPGECIATHLIPMSMMTNHVDNSILASMGIRPAAINKPMFYASHYILFAKRAGIFAGLEGLEEAAKIPCIEHLKVFLDRGDVVQVPPDEFLKHRIASILMRDEDYDVLVATADKLDRLLVPKINPKIVSVRAERA